MLNQLYGFIKPFMPGSAPDDTNQQDSETLQAGIAKEAVEAEQQCLQKIADEKVQLFQKLLAEGLESVQGGNTIPSSLQGKGTVKGTGNVVSTHQPTFRSPIPPEQIPHFMCLHVIASNYSIHHLPPNQKEAYVKFRNDWLVSWHNFSAAQKAMYHRAHVAAANEFKKNEQKDDPEPAKKRGRRQLHPNHQGDKNTFSENRNFFNM